MDPCLPELLPASYGGVGFFVDNDDGKYGRRIVKHSYPMRDIPYLEDLGEDVNDWTVKAYVFGPDAVAQKDALIAVCRSRGAKPLILPADALSAVCHTASVTRSKDKAGWFDFTLSFTRDNGAGAGPFVSSILFERALADTATLVANAFGLLFGEAMAVGDVLDFVPANQVGRVQTYAATMLSMVQSGPVSTATSADIITQIDGLSANAYALIRPPVDQVAGIFCSDASFVKPDTPYYNMSSAFRDSGAAVALALTVADLTGRVLDNLAPVDARRAAVTLASFSIAESAPISASVSDLADSINGHLFNALVRVQGCLQWARAVAQAPYALRADAITARANIVTIMDSQIELLGTEGEAVLAVMNARDLCAKMLSDLILNIAPVITVYAPQSLPSLYWASRLYGDVSRAQELADSNNVTNPNFMPMLFKAKSR